MELIVDIYGKVDFDEEGEQFYMDSGDTIRTKDGRRFKAKFAIYDLEEVGTDDED